MTEFVRVTITSTATELADDAVARLQDVWAVWQPNDADQEVVQIETLAPMAQNAAEVASRVPAAVLRQIGSLEGVAYQQGASAIASTTWVLEDSDGHRIPAGSQVDIDGYIFATQTDVDVLPGDDTATGVTVAATETGTLYNDLTGVTVTPISALDWVSEVTLDAPTANGADPETDDAYTERYARRLRLRAQTIITLRDHERFALDYTGIGRAIAIKPTAGGPRDVELVLTDLAGDPVSSGLKATILAAITDPNVRRVNVDVTSISDPTYTTVDVDWTAKFSPGYEPADVIDRVNATLTDVLSPLEWGLVRGTDGIQDDQWINETVVRWNKILGVIEAVPGLDYVVSLSLNGGGSGANVTLTGDVPLPQAGTMTGAAA